MWTTPEHEKYRLKIREFAESEVNSYATRVDREQVFPDHIIPKLTEMGLLGMQVDKKYGGSYTDTLTYAIAVEELSRVCGSTGITVAAHNSLGNYPIYKFGTEQQKQKYLPEITSGGKLAAFGLTEPGAGSDAGGTKTFAAKVDGGYKVNGTKCWITCGGICSTAVFTARTSKEPGSKSISSFIVKHGTEGFSSGKKENKLGLRGSDTRFLHFDDVFIPDEDLVGEEGHGFKQFMITLDGGRVSIAAMALGLAQGAYDVAVKYAALKKQAGKPIGYQQGIGFKLADMATQIQAARHLVYHSAVLKDSGQRFSKESAMAKLFASEAGTYVCWSAIGILGEIGLTDKFPVERMWRDVKLDEIGEGTSEVQRLVISRMILKEATESESMFGFPEGWAAE
ncbi:MAG: acyl-CoA dehydrogenase family protein [candidate division Zixibacteria bacterium]|nr:acyl-CoA dehydrogenase family protein [candidate division Zixibacteria bacterium]